MLKKKIPNETISSTLHLWSVPAPCNSCVSNGGLFPRSWSRCYTPIFISTFCRFRVSSAVMNWSGVSDDPLFTKCTISWDLLASPLSPLGFLSSMVPFPLLITSFFFCPHLLLLLTAMQTARIKAKARRDAKMISHSGIWGFRIGPEVVFAPCSSLPLECPADSDAWVV